MSDALSQGSKTPAHASVSPTLISCQGDLGSSNSPRPPAHCAKPQVCASLLVRIPPGHRTRRARQRQDYLGALAPVSHQFHRYEPSLGPSLNRRRRVIPPISELIAASRYILVTAPGDREWRLVVETQHRSGANVM